MILLYPDTVPYSNVLDIPHTKAGHASMDKPSRLSDSERYYAQVPVWEPRLRLWHWGNLLLILLLILTYLLFDWHRELGIPKPTYVLTEKIHAYIGYVFALLVLARLHLAFHGQSFSRWADLDPRHEGKGFLAVMKEEIALHLRPRTDSKGLPLPDPDPGHNRLGRFLYLPLFVVLLPLQALTGILWASLKWGFYPLPFLHALSPAIGKPLKEVVSNIHAAGFYAILGFLALHLGGLVKYELTFGSDLFSSMIHGRKILTREAAENYEEIAKDRIAEP